MRKIKRWMTAIIFLGLTGLCVLIVLRPDLPWRLGQCIRWQLAENPLSVYLPARTEHITPPQDESPALLLINEAHRLSEEMIPVVGPYADSGAVTAICLQHDFAELAAAAKAATGEPLLIRDDFRTHQEQKALYEADPQLAAPPGTGEHELGLALDVCVRGFGGYSFLKTAAGRFVGENAWRYGFIIRYPDGGEAVTGIPYEPWHLRWVGEPHAAILTQSGLCLEEYGSLLGGTGEASFWQWEDWIVSRQPVGADYLAPSGMPLVSFCPDNTGYVILTWRR